MNKEEKERKEAAAKAEFERRMRQLQATGAPSADDLLKSVGSIPLSPGDSPESNPAAVVAAPQDDFPEQPQPPSRTAEFSATTESSDAYSCAAYREPCKRDRGPETGGSAGHHRGANKGATPAAFAVKPQGSGQGRQRHLLSSF